MNASAGACVCTLKGAELVDRIEAWKQVVSRATARRIEGDRVIGTYPDDEQLLERLRGLIAAEASCCSFLAFTIEQQPDQIVTELRLSPEMPDTMRTMILALVGPVD